MQLQPSQHSPGSNEPSVVLEMSAELETYKQTLLEGTNRLVMDLYQICIQALENIKSDGKKGDVEEGMTKTSASCEADLYNMIIDLVNQINAKIQELGDWNVSLCSIRPYFEKMCLDGGGGDEKLEIESYLCQICELNQHIVTKGRSKGITLKQLPLSNTSSSCTLL